MRVIKLSAGVFIKVVLPGNKRERERERKKEGKKERKKERKKFFIQFFSCLFTAKANHLFHGLHKIPIQIHYNLPKSV